VVFQCHNFYQKTTHLKNIFGVYTYFRCHYEENNKAQALLYYIVDAPVNNDWGICISGDKG
jgi:hypothetical protein